MFDIQGHMAIVIFKGLKSCGVSPDDVTYNIMIDCCSILRCFRSASVLASMMFRSGYTPQNFTYTALVKVSLSSVLLINQETAFSTCIGNRRSNLCEELMIIVVVFVFLVS